MTGSGETSTHPGLVVSIQLVSSAPTTAVARGGTVLDFSPDGDSGILDVNTGNAITSKHTSAASHGADDNWKRDKSFEISATCFPPSTPDHAQVDRTPKPQLGSIMIDAVGKCSTVWKPEN
ncbi:hypothetical protein BDW69DRAFT_183641 [Aspergillus filifer]